MFLNLDFDVRVARGSSLFGTDLLLVLRWVLSFPFSSDLPSTWVADIATVSHGIHSLLQGFLRFIER